MPPPAIGLATAVALVVGNMIGSGVFLLPASLAPYRGTSLVGWGISTVGSVFLALVGNGDQLEGRGRAHLPHPTDLADQR